LAPWLAPVILATQEAEIRRIRVRSQPGQIVPKTLSWKHPTQNKPGGVAQGTGPEFKPQYHEEEEERRRRRRKKKKKKGEEEGEEEEEEEKKKKNKNKKKNKEKNKKKN
jgi:hypothetical protein